MVVRGHRSLHSLGSHLRATNRWNFFYELLPISLCQRSWGAPVGHGDYLGWLLLRINILGKKYFLWLGHLFHLRLISVRLFQLPPKESGLTTDNHANVSHQDASN